MEEPSRHHRRALPRGHVRSPPHHWPLHHAHSSATTSRTTSTPPLEQPSQGKGRLLIYPARSSPECHRHHSPPWPAHLRRSLPSLNPVPTPSACVDALG
jgi:hypothetical protein